MRTMISSNQSYVCQDRTSINEFPQRSGEGPCVMSGEELPAMPKKINKKKIYHKPVLTIYGDIVSLTATAGSAGLTDGGTVVGFMMTH